MRRFACKNCQIEMAMVHIGHDLPDVGSVDIWECKGCATRIYHDVVSGDANGNNVICACGGISTRETGHSRVDMAFRPPSPYKIYLCNHWSCACGGHVLHNEYGDVIVEHFQDDFDGTLALAIERGDYTYVYERASHVPDLGESPVAQVRGIVGGLLELDKLISSEFDPDDALDELLDEDPEPPMDSWEDRGVM